MLKAEAVAISATASALKILKLSGDLSVLKIVLPQDMIVPVYGADGFHTLQQRIQLQGIVNVKGNLAFENTLLLFL